MTRAMAFKLTITAALRTAWYIFLCAMIGSLAGRIVRYFGGPMELRIVVFVSVTAAALAIVWYGRKLEAKPLPDRASPPAEPSK